MKKTLQILAVLALAVLSSCKEGKSDYVPHDPKVLSIIPKAGYPGTEAIISGWWFEGKAVSVDIGGTPANVVSSTMDRIMVVMPEKELGSYEVTVTVDGRSRGGVSFRYAEHPEQETIEIYSYTPDHGYVGEEVTIGGRMFSARKDHNSVTIGGLDCEVLSATTSRLVVRIPDLEPGKYPFVVTSDGETATGPDFTYDPKPTLSITSVTPNVGSVGDILTLEGFCFGETPQENVVKLNGVQAEVLEASSRTLRIVAPENPNGSYPVVITVGDNSAEGPEFLYIDKQFTYRVRTISGSIGRAADVNTVIDGDSSSAKYWQPRGIVFLPAPDGRMVIFDNGNNAFRFMTLAGTYNVTHSVSAKGYLNAAWRGCVHGDWIYMASKGNNRIVRYNYKTDESGIVAANFTGTSPMDVCFDASGNGYVLVRDGSKAIFKATGDDFTTLESFATFDDGPLAMEFAPDGNLIVTTNGCQVISVAPNGAKTVIAGIRAAKADDNGEPGQPLTAKFGANLFGMTLDASGNIYVADDSFKIIKFIRKGDNGYTDATVLTVAGTSGTSAVVDGDGTSAAFGTPGEIRMAPDGRHIYVSEYSNFVIREIELI